MTDGSAPRPDSSSRGPVELVAYDPRWPEVFRVEAVRLRRLFGGSARGIHHMGSTGVPGLAAKPTIDVLVEAESLEVVDARTPRLEAEGLEARGEYGMPGRRYFVGRTASGERLHVHVFEEGSARAREHLAFRDHLRAHPGDAWRYEQLKRGLALNPALDRADYQAGKAAFIEDRLKRGGGREKPGG